MIEPVNRNNFEDVLPLIRDYQTFYRVANIDENKNRRHFSQFIDDHTRGELFLIRDNANAVGFATIYYGFSSTRAEEVGTLNDLFVLPEYRGRGFGKKLIEHAKQIVKIRGLSRLQWLTAADNHVAQGLYDTCEASKSAWVFYAMDV